MTQYFTETFVTNRLLKTKLILLMVNSNKYDKNESYLIQNMTPKSLTLVHFFGDWLYEKRTETLCVIIIIMIIIIIFSHLPNTNCLGFIEPFVLIMTFNTSCLCIRCHVRRIVQGSFETTSENTGIYTQ